MACNAVGIVPGPILRAAKQAGNAELPEEVLKYLSSKREIENKTAKIIQFPGNSKGER